MKMVETRFRLITPVWGADYVELYVNVVLPTMLSQGNLGSLPPERTIYTIYTTAEDEQLIRRSAAYKELAAHCPTEFISIDDVLRTTGWTRSTENRDAYYKPLILVHRMAIATAVQDSAVCLLFIQPDSVFADGTFKFCVEAASQGKRAALIHTLRVDQTAFRRALESEVAAKSGLARSVTPRHLVDLILRFPHPTVGGLWWNGCIRETSPSHMLFPAGDSGLVSCGMHYHPLMVRPEGSKQLPLRTIDDDYLGRLRIGPRQVAVATDSDQGIGCEMSQAQQHVRSLGPETVWTTRSLAFVLTGRDVQYHRLCMRYPAYLHRGDPAPERDQADAKARRVVAEIRAWMILCWIFRVHQIRWAWLTIKIPIQQRFGRTPVYLLLKRIKVALVG